MFRYFRGNEYFVDNVGFVFFFSVIRIYFENLVCVLENNFLDVDILKGIVKFSSSFKVLGSFKGRVGRGKVGIFRIGGFSRGGEEVIYWFCEYCIYVNLIVMLFIVCIICNYFCF